MKTFKIFEGKQYPFETISEQNAYLNMRAERILSHIRNGDKDKYSRWDVYMFRNEIKPMMAQGAEYEDCYDEVVSQIESAKEFY